MDVENKTKQKNKKKKKGEIKERPGKERKKKNKDDSTVNNKEHVATWRHISADEPGGGKNLHPSKKSSCRKDQ